MHSASAALLEGEEMCTLTASSEQTAALGTPSSFNTPTLPATPAEAAPLPEPALELCNASSPLAPAMNAYGEPAFASQHTTTAAVEIWFDNPDPQPSDGVDHSGTLAPRPASSTHPPGAFAEDPGESGGVQTVENGAPPPLEDLDRTESTFMAKTSDANVPAPRTLAEAKHSLDIIPWEKATEEKPDARKAHPAAQGFEMCNSTVNHNDPHTAHLSQPACINAIARHHRPPDPELFSMPNHTPGSATDCASTSDEPNREAIGTLDWAVLATCPDTTLTNANGSTAVGLRAASGHAFPFDSGTIPSPTTKSNNAAATHGSTEAPRPHTLVPDTPGGPKALITPFSDVQAPPTFTCDHQHHPQVERIDTRHYQVIKKGPTRPVHYFLGGIVADACTSSLLSAKEKHFAASLGLHMK